MVGEGTQRQRTEQLAESLGLADRITLRAPVDESELVDLYKDALAIVFTPFDEDYGYVTLESFLAHKPVITTPDSGGPLEFVRDTRTAWCASPRRRESRLPSIALLPTGAWPRVSATPDTIAHAS